MTNIFIRSPGQDPFEIPKNQVIAAIKNGELSANQEISLDGQSWTVLDQHKQLGALFNQEAPKPPPAPKLKVVSETVFYASDRVNCPKCGHEQDRGDACADCNVLFEKYWESQKAKTQKKTEGAIEPELNADESGSFFHKLWNGKYPLWKTLWIFGVAYPMCILVPLQLIFVWKMQGIVEGVMNQNPALDERVADVIAIMAVEMKTYFMVFAVVMLVYLVYAFILNVGLWRSANNYTGAGIWRILIRIAVVLYFIALPFNVFGIYEFSTGFEDQMTLFQNQFKQMQEIQ